MAFLDDITGGADRVAIGEPGGDPIIVDASVRETHSVSGQISDHPVESGIDIVDHYRVLPRKVQIEGVITDTPIATGFPGTTLINSAAGLINGDEKPSVNAWLELQRFFDKAVVVNIRTSLRLYENMVLTDLSVTRDTKTAQGLHFTVSGREVRFVDTEFGAILPPDPVSTSGQKEKARGKQTNTNANAEQATQSSAALKLLQGIGVLQ